MDPSNDKAADKSPSKLDQSSGKRPRDSPLKARLQSRFWKKPKTITDDRMKIGNITLNTSSSQAIVFRVTLLGHLKEGSKDGHECYRFHGMDETGEIAFFSFDRAQEVANMIKLNGVYKLEKFSTREEDPGFPQNTGIKLQIVIGKDSNLVECMGLVLPAIPFAFTEISNIRDKNMTVGDRVDVFGVVAEDWGVEKTSKGTIKRDLRIGDRNRNEIIITLWGTLGQEFNCELGSAVAIRKAIIKELFEERLLSATSCTLGWVKPELPDNRPAEIEAWFSAESKDTNN